MEKKKIILSSLEERIKTLNVICQDSELVGKIEKVVELICGAYRSDRKVIFMGNGGSASQAQHFAAELIGRFKLERKALKSLALTANTSILTAVGNDYGFDKIFSRQIEALVEAGDIVIGLSTSGNSPNVIEGIKLAKELGADVIGFTGARENKLTGLVDVNIAVPSEHTPEIQEFHLMIGHLICEMVEATLF